MQCDEVAELLPRIVEDGERADDNVIRHVESCLRCQAEMVRYRKLLKALHDLRTDVLEPAPGLLSDILAALEAAGERSSVRSMLRGRRAAYAGGLAVATAAGAAGVIVYANRARRSKSPKSRLRAAS